MILSDLIRKAYRHNQVITAYVYGDFGFGKTSYALWIAYEVLGSWDKVLNHLFFTPIDAIKVLDRAIRKRERLKIIIMDDAGLWLDRLTWWEADKIAFMQFFNLIRSVASGVIFTTPSQELPRQIARKCFFRIRVTPVPRERVVELMGRSGYESLVARTKEFGLKPLFCQATGYKLKLLPTFFEYVKKEFYDVYPYHYPIFEAYEEKRRGALRSYFDKWREQATPSSDRNRLREIASEMLESGRSRREIINFLRQKGIPRSTAYRWIKELAKLSA